tara:strand:+ start:82 stop:651 length:570 start_codon:yes stop_codon:yes gene_type:complete
MLIEYPEALAVVWQNAGKQHTPFVLLAGRVGVPLQADLAGLGVTGEAILLGKPAAGSTGAWIGSSASTALSAGCRVRSGNGPTQWFSGYLASAATTYGNLNTASGTLIGDAIHPCLQIGAALVGGDSNRSSPVLQAELLRHYSSSASQGSTSLTARTLLSGAVDGWLALDDNSTTASILLGTQINKPLT